MSEIRRSDNHDLEHYIKHLQEKGLKPQGKLRFASTTQNVVGDVQDTPSMYTCGITLNLTGKPDAKLPTIAAKTASSKFKRVVAQHLHGHPHHPHHEGHHPEGHHTEDSYGTDPMGYGQDAMGGDLLNADPMGGDQYDQDAYSPDSAGQDGPDMSGVHDVLNGLQDSALNFGQGNPNDLMYSQQPSQEPHGGYAWDAPSTHTEPIRYELPDADWQ